VTALFRAWADAAARRRWLKDEATVRAAKRPTSMRLQWPDGTIVAVWFEPKGDAKSIVALAHTKLRDSAASASAKKSWTERLDALGTMLAD
jgi:hypothetical protein